MPAIGETVSYMSLSGMFYDAVIKHVSPNGRLAIDVNAGVREPVHFIDIEWIDQRNFATRGTAGPKVKR